MRRFWKLLRVLWAMATRTPYVNLRASSLSAAEELRFRAYRNHVGCRLLCDILGIEVRMDGSPPSRDGMLVVSNHFGVLDPLVLAAVFPMVPVGRADVKDWPLLGYVSTAHGMIPVERDRRTSAVRFAAEVRERLAAGVNVVVFPEGTTSYDPAIRPFKTGAFEAVADLPDGRVLPVYLDVESIDGRTADDQLRRRVVWADSEQTFTQYAVDVAETRHMTFTVYVGHPISTVDRDRKELAQLAFKAVEDLQARRRLPSD